MLVSERHGSLVPGLGRLERFGPSALGIISARGVAQLAARAMDQEGSEVDVPAFGDPAEPQLAPGGVLPRREPHPGGELSRVFEVMAITDGGDDRRGGDGPDAVDLGQLPGARIGPHESLDLTVVGEHAAVQDLHVVVELIEHGPGESGDIRLMVLADQRPSGFEGGDPLGRDDTELGEKAPQAVDRPGVLGDTVSAQAMNQQDGLLIDAFNGDEAHSRSPCRFADGDGVVEIILPGAALVAIGGDEAGIDDPGLMAELGELPRPVVGAGAGLHGDDDGRCVGEELEQAGAVEGLSQHDVPVLINAADGKGILGQINTDADNL